MDEGRKKLRQSRFDFLTNGTLYIIDNFSSGSGRPVFWISDNNSRRSRTQLEEEEKKKNPARSSKVGQ